MRRKKPSITSLRASRSGISRRRFLSQGAAGLTASVLAARASAVPDAVATNTAETGQRAVLNRAPLQQTPFAALPLGSIQARGWLLHQLELQRDGLTGHAEEILPAVDGSSAWLGGTGEGWEKGPYYLKGLTALAYTLDDAGLKAKAQKWIDAILKSQRPDGFFGPASNDDWWPRMVATYALRDYAEATGDPRVIPHLTRYYRHMAGAIGPRPLRDWGRARAGDEIDTIFWLYNRTGDAFLLPLADTLHQQAYDWTDIFTNNRFLEFGDDFQPKHNVNVPQAMKMPAVYWQRSNNALDREAFHAGDVHLRRDHGLSPGMSSGTEFLAGKSSTQGIELCSIVERMLSEESVIRILGDASIGDNLEFLAFNALPAALTKSIRQHVYYTLPNNVAAKRGGMGYDQDHEDGRTPAPRSGFPCCCYNFHMGWPKFVQNSWATTAEGGLAVISYAPSEVTAYVGDGTRVTFAETTDYPFADTIRLTLTTRRPVRFPLKLRVPTWCRRPSIHVNGKPQSGVAPGAFAVLDRAWKSGDVVTVKLPMAVEAVPGVNESVSIRRGPMLYSLQIAEKWEVLEHGTLPGFDSYQVTPTSEWNYGLLIDRRNPGASFTLQQRAMPANPFEQAHTPVTLTARGRKIPEWTLAWNGRSAFDPPVRPAASSVPSETITLVPFGSEMLRITDFPVIGSAAAASRTFRDSFAQDRMKDWIVYGGGWYTRHGELHTGAGNFGMTIAAGTQFADFTYDARVTAGAAGDAGLVFRVSKPAIGPDAYQGYYVGLSAERNRVEIGRADNKWTSLRTADRPVTAGRTYSVRVRAEGPRLQVWVEDMARPVLDIRDDSFREGAIGVRHYGTSAAGAAAFSHLAVDTL